MIDWALARESCLQILLKNPFYPWSHIAASAALLHIFNHEGYHELGLIHLESHIPQHVQNIAWHALPKLSLLKTKMIYFLSQCQVSASHNRIEQMCTPTIGGLLYEYLK